MNELQQLNESHGLLLVFVNVLLEQIGLPVPAYPTLIVTGALAMQSKPLLGAGVLVAMLACLIADALWYWAGKRYGSVLLKSICKISLSQDTCIRQGLNVYERVGPRAMLLSKFLPGAGALVTTVAGMNATPFAVFMRYSLAGSFIWAGSALLLGMLFSDALIPLLDWLSGYLPIAIGAVLGLLGVFIAWKYWKRRRLQARTARVPRITVPQLLALRDSDQAPVIIDVRPRFHTAVVEGIPGAVSISLEEPLEPWLDQLNDVDMVFYCACPNELSAALLAEKLHARGLTRGKALVGGLDAWREAQVAASDPPGKAATA
ncbi:VTT domain-containing protein [Pseudomonas sp. NFR16]|uniref:VTT domain-containing protein n=1 Tax=Pseudomonas sp. NFR16 TaxID=1566248 RepID=UPI0008AF7585|nr:VTT domain-containing protein [Pseudomonas sp. NFR16]SEI58266.1 membrane protein DedA, SNARE-associated domain [Pseudomonas sp. NFR16]